MTPVVDARGRLTRTGLAEVVGRGACVYIYMFVHTDMSVYISKEPVDPTSRRQGPVDPKGLPTDPFSANGPVDGPVDVILPPTDRLTSRLTYCSWPFSTLRPLPTAPRRPLDCCKGLRAALSGSGEASGAGTRVAFFALFTYKKEPRGDLFGALNIFSRKKGRSERDEYLREAVGASGKECKRRNWCQPVASSCRLFRGRQPALNVHNRTFGGQYALVYRLAPCLWLKGSRREKGVGP